MNTYKKILENTLTFTVSCNDFFNYASADIIEIDTLNLEWIIPIVEKFGDDGMDACISYIRKQKPIPHFLTEKFNNAYKSIEKLEPKIYEIE
jgi:hypothetical protein